MQILEGKEGKSELNIQTKLSNYEFIRSNTKALKIGFIGLGKLGRDVSEVFGEFFDIIGYDIRPVEVNIPTAIDLKSAVIEKDIVFIAVQTPHDDEYDGKHPTSHLSPKDFDYSVAIDSVKKIDELVSPQTLIVLISTVLPGTVRREIAPLVRNGRFIYNPYLIAQGTVKADMYEPEMIMIGTEKGEKNNDFELLKYIYNVICYEPPRIELGTWEEIESMKIFYNTFITAKLCLVNLIQDTAMAVGNMNSEVVANALKNSTNRIMGPSYMRPGLGDGGGCHPRDNIALRSLVSRYDFKYDIFDSIMFAREKQAENIALHFETIGIDKSIPCVVLGSGFKPGISYENGSPSVLVGYYLEQLGYMVTYFSDNSDAIKEKSKSIGSAAYLLGWYGYFQDFPFEAHSYVIDPWREIKLTSHHKDKNIRVFHFGNTRENELGEIKMIN